MEKRFIINPKGDLFRFFKFMERTKKMSATTLERIKGSELPDSLLKRLQGQPDQVFIILPESEIELDDDGNLMLPESAFRIEFVKEIEKQRREDHGKGSTICRTKEENDAFFKEVWDQNE